MNSSELKKLIVSSLNSEVDSGNFPGRVEAEGVSFDFSEEFNDKILNKLFSEKQTVVRELDFVKSLNLVFYRIALTGVAAIVLLLLSIYFMEGSLSVNSFLGLSDTYDESIVCMLTGN